MPTVERPALVEIQRGQVMLSTTLEPEQLKELCEVDWYDPNRIAEPDNGYQRRPSTSRIAQAGSFYGEGIEKRQGREFEDRQGLMPNPIVANIRPSLDEDSIFPAGVTVSFFTDADRHRVEHAATSGGNATACATVMLTEDTIAWIVDGQHRGGAVKLLSDKRRMSGDFPVPVKILLNLGRDEEIKQFYYINSQAKNVPTDLTADLVQRMAKQDDAEADYLSERKNKSRLLQGGAIFEAMVANKTPWLTRIKKPNEPASKDTSIAISQFITSLSPLLSAPLPRTLTPTEWAKVIDAYWEAVERLLPLPFDPTEQARSWVLLKSTGVNVMHRVLADCLTILVQRNARLSDSSEYEQLLQDLPTLSGQVTDMETGDDFTVDGAEFWRSSSVASQFTGRYGADRLVGKIRGLIAKSNQAVNI